MSEVTQMQGAEGAYREPYLLYGERDATEPQRRRWVTF